MQAPRRDRCGSGGVKYLVRGTLVGLSGLEPLTSALSGRLSTPAPQRRTAESIHRSTPTSVGWRHRCHAVRHAALILCQLWRAAATDVKRQGGNKIN
jgi:hypothetical protein